MREVGVRRWTRGFYVPVLFSVLHVTRCENGPEYRSFQQGNSNIDYGEPSNEGQVPLQEVGQCRGLDGLNKCRC